MSYRENYRAGLLDFDPFGISAFPTADIGGVSFGLIGPDGTGIKYLAFLGETGSAWYTNGPQFLNAGTPYDGLYNDHPEHERSEARVTVSVFDVSGQKVSHVFRKTQP